HPELEERLDYLTGLVAHRRSELTNRDRLGELDQLTLDLLGRLGHDGLGRLGLDLDLRKRRRRGGGRRSWTCPSGRRGRAAGARGGAGIGVAGGRAGVEAAGATRFGGARGAAGPAAAGGATAGRG